MDKVFIHSFNNEKIDILIDNIKNKKYILLGENTHGTKEYYDIRTKITTELCKIHKNVYILFESDWLPLLKINIYINNKTHNLRQSFELIKDYPLWMVRNESMLNLVKKLRKLNNKNKNKNINLLGIDCYDVKKSALFLKLFFDKFNIPITNLENFYDILKKSNDMWEFIKSINNLKNYLTILSDKVNILLKKKIKNFTKLNITQLLQIINSGCQYYEAASNITDDNSWNIRDTHWLNTIKNIDKISEHKNKIFIIWAHNSHVGDRKWMEWGKNDKINIGKLVRQNFGKNNSSLIGFYTSNGTLTATNNWHQPPNFYTLKPSKKNSYEKFFENICKKYNSNKLIIFLNYKKYNDTIPKIAETREIGVNYKKNSENISHYSKINLSNTYDIVFYIKNTNAVKPLDKNKSWIMKYNSNKKGGFQNKIIKLLLNIDYIY